MKKMALDEIYKKVKADYDIEGLIEPYSEGGTEDQPVTRTSGTILDWLINKKRFSPDIAGAGLVATLMEMKQGKSFVGDESYGSKGREFIQYVARKCDAFNKQNLRVELFKTIAGAKLEVMEEAVFEMVRGQLPWFIRVVSPGSWRWWRRRSKMKQQSAEVSGESS